MRSSVELIGYLICWMVHCMATSLNSLKDGYPNTLGPSKIIT